jgi:glutathione synthase/RimK-type ligase-like ATP-grasp enzyme
MRSCYLVETDYKKNYSSTRLIINGFKRRGYRIILIDPDKLVYVLSAKQLEIFHGKERISDSKLLIVRGTRNASTEAYNLAKAFQSLGAAVIDPADSLGAAGSKFVPHLERINAIDFPTSVFFSQVKADSYKRILASEIKPPFLVKPQKGHFGQGVAIIKNAKDLAAYAKQYGDTPIIAQPKMDIVREYRVLVLGKKSLGVCEKNLHSVLKKPIQGATFRFIQNKRVEKFGLKAVARGKCHFYGVDVAETRSGDLYVLEANRTPGFDAFQKASGLPIDDYFVDYCLKAMSQQ